MSTSITVPPAGKLAYRPGQAVQASGIARSTLYELLNSGEIPSFKIGKTTLILAEDLTAFLRRRAERTGRSAPHDPRRCARVRGEP